MKKWIIRAAAILVLIAVAAVMMVIGRGHTVYFDNKTLEYNGTEYKALNRVEVILKGERVAKLDARDRGVGEWIGQNLHMDLVVKESKDSEEKGYSIDLKLPYDMDNPVINIPALLAGNTQDVWLDEFIPTIKEEPEDVGDINTDEFSTEDFGE